MNIHTFNNDPTRDPNSNPIVNIYKPTNISDSPNNSNINNSNSFSSPIRLITNTNYSLKTFCAIILIINTIIYILQLLYFYIIKKNISWHCTLYNFGAKDTYSIVQYYQFYRFFTSMFLHASIIHILMNSLSIFFLGFYLGKKIGVKKIIILYISSGIFASIFSACINRHSISVGASGAIMGFSGILIVDYFLSYHKMNDAQKKNFMYFGIMTLINLFGTNVSGDGNKVDNSAHLGGFIIGVCLSVFLLQDNIDIQYVTLGLLKKLKIVFGCVFIFGPLFCLIYLFYIAQIYSNQLKNRC